MALFFDKFHYIYSFIDFVLNRLINILFPFFKLQNHPSHGHVKDLLLLCFLPLQCILCPIQQEFILLVSYIPYGCSIILQLRCLAHFAFHFRNDLNMADFFLILHQAAVLATLLGVTSFTEWNVHLFHTVLRKSMELTNILIFELYLIYHVLPGLNKGLPMLREILISCTSGATLFICLTFFGVSAFLFNLWWIENRGSRAKELCLGRHINCVVVFLYRAFSQIYFWRFDCLIHVGVWSDGVEYVAHSGCISKCCSWRHLRCSSKLHGGVVRAYGLAKCLIECHWPFFFRRFQRVEDKTRLATRVAEAIIFLIFCYFHYLR